MVPNTTSTLTRVQYQDTRGHMNSLRIEESPYPRQFIEKIVKTVSVYTVTKEGQKSIASKTFLNLKLILWLPIYKEDGLREFQTNRNLIKGNTTKSKTKV